MVYGNSWVHICNHALGRLGSASIADLDTVSSRDQNVFYCNLYLPDAVEYILGLFDWKCTRKRTSIAPDVDAPAFGYDYQFLLPGDWLREISIDAGGEPWVIESGKLLTNSNTLNIVYIARPTEPTKLTPMVQNAIEKYLAYLLTTPLTSSEKISARIAGEVMDAIEKAKENDVRASYDPLADGDAYSEEGR